MRTSGGEADKVSAAFKDRTIAYCNLNNLLDHAIYPPPQTAAGGNKSQSSNTIMSTSFALEY